MVKVVAIIQARLSSTRLPAKVMLDIKGKTMLERVIDRVKLAIAIDEIWVATSNNKEDNLIINIANSNDVLSYEGDLKNVFSRYYDIMMISAADIIIRVTADNPLTEPKFIDKSVEVINTKKVDYTRFDNIPLGTGVEAFTANSFQRIHNDFKLDDGNLEHVTSFYYQNPDLFNISTLIVGKSQPLISLTVDTFEDYVNMNYYYEELIKRNVNPKNYLAYILERGNN